MTTDTYSPATAAAERRRQAKLQVAAEVRATEEGHQARLDAERGCFLVKSDSNPDVTYELFVTARAGYVAVECSCPAGLRKVPVGHCRCKHGARVLRRLEREGLVRFNGERWVVTTKGDALGRDVTIHDCSGHRRTYKGDAWCAVCGRSLP